MTSICTQQKSYGYLGFQLISVLTRNGCIQCYISLFTEIILQQLIEFQTKIQGSLTKLCVFKVSRGHPSKVAKLPIIASGAENMEYLINIHDGIIELHPFCEINVLIRLTSDLGITGFNHFVPVSKICVIMGC